MRPLVSASSMSRSLIYMDGQDIQDCLTRAFTVLRKKSLLQNSLGSGIYCREELLSLGNPWLARCRSLSRALFCRSILPPSHARLRILQKAQKLTRFLEQKRCARTVTVNRWSLRAIVPATAAWWRRSSFFFWFFFVVLRAPSWISFCPSWIESRRFLPLVGNAGRLHPPSGSVATHQPFP